MHNLFVKSFFVLSVTLSIFFSPLAFSGGLYLSEPDWISLYQIEGDGNTVAPSEKVIAKFPQGVKFIRLDDKTIDGKYFVMLWGASVYGYVDSKGLKQIQPDSRFDAFAYYASLNINIDILRGTGADVFAGYRQVDNKLIDIQVSPFWNSLIPSMQENYENRALEWWVIANLDDAHQNYCVKFINQHTEIKTLCSTPEIVNKVKKRIFEN